MNYEEQARRGALFGDRVGSPSNHARVAVGLSRPSPDFFATTVPLSAAIRAWYRCARTRTYTHPSEGTVSMEGNVTDTNRGRYAGTEPARLVGPDEVAVFLGVPLRTVYRWRSRGEGPPGYRVGRHVRYRVEDVDHWLDEHRDRPLVMVQPSADRSADGRPQRFAGTSSPQAARRRRGQH